MRWKKRNEKKIRARTDRLFRRRDKARERGKEREKRNIISGFLPLLLAHPSLMLSTNVSRFSFFFLFSSFLLFFHKRSFERLMRSSKIIDEFFVVFISRFVSGEKNSIYREICYLFVHLFVRKIISRKKSQFF